MPAADLLGRELIVFFHSSSEGGERRSSYIDELMSCCGKYSNCQSSDMLSRVVGVGGGIPAMFLIWLLTNFLTLIGSVSREGLWANVVSMARSNTIERLDLLSEEAINAALLVA